MKPYALIVPCLILAFLTGCQPELPDTSLPNREVDSQVSSASPQSQIVNQVVEASCGQCQLEMQGDGCDLALRIDGKSYFVDGSSIDDHGDAHGDSGLCNCIRQARVSGEIKDGRFVATSFHVLPKGKQPDDGIDADKKEHDQ